jgi:hypothetical protein
LDVLVSWFTANWDEIKAFFNSVFFTAIAGSLAGAFAGAWAAQRIAERGKYRDQLLKEIRDTNAATTIAFGICNSLLSVKKQHVKALMENYANQRAALLEHKRKRDAGEIPRDAEFHFFADLQTLSLPPLPVDVLQRQIFEKLSIRGRPLNLTTTLGQSIHGLSTMLERRNQLIESYKSSGKPLDPALYFGLPQRGAVNEDYPSAIKGIYDQSEDSIFFSQLLCKDLVEHCRQVAARFKTEFGRGAPQVSEPDFVKAEQAGLMPDGANYRDWLTMFKKAEPEQGWIEETVWKCVRVD